MNEMENHLLQGDVTQRRADVVLCVHSNLKLWLKLSNLHMY